MHRHDLLVPKRDGPQPDYVPSGIEIDDAMLATKAIRSLLRHGDIERLPGEERKSLTAFSFGNSGWILPPQLADRVLSCLVDQTSVASLLGLATTSAGSIVFPLDNVDFTDSVGWACETDCAVNQPSPDLSGLGQLEIKAEEIRARVCAGADKLADASFNVE
jgi:HK97 family phage major capsid protein